MDSRVGDDVLAQELNADVHQLKRIQSTSAQMGTRCSMRTDAVEPVVNAHVHEGTERPDAIERIRVPGQRSVQVTEYAISGHKGFCCAVFLCRASVVENGSRCFGLRQVFPDCNSCAQAAGP